MYNQPRSFGLTVAPSGTGMSHEERIFFELVGPAIKDEPLVFLRSDRRYHYGSGNEKTVVRITAPDFFRRVLTEGNLGLGECYMEEKFEILHGSLEGLLSSLARSSIEKSIRSRPLNALKLAPIYLRNLARGRYRNVQSHYDLGEDLFESFLDESMAYSCGYQVLQDDTLSDLQIQKFDRICRKLRISPGETLLDIGCGFGGLLIHAARHYGAVGTGITISRHHHRRATANVQAQGLAERIDIRFASHKALQGRFDKVVSVGMFEHLSRRDYPVFFGNVRRVLPEGGMGLLHTVGATGSKNRHDPFIQKYMLPGSRTPKLSEVSYWLEKNDLPIIDVENIAPHYAPTLRGWAANFQKNYSRLDRSRYDERVKRMFEYFFACCTAAATASDSAVFQVLFTNSFRIERMPLHRV